LTTELSMNAQLPQSATTRCWRWTVGPFQLGRASGPAQRGQDLRWLLAYHEVGLDERAADPALCRSRRSREWAASSPVTRGEGRGRSLVRNSALWSRRAPGTIRHTTRQRRQSMSESTLRSKLRLRLSLLREVSRLGCHACEGRADALELILRGLEGAQLSGAERRPAASEETRDKGSVAAQLLGGVETAVGVWQEEIWRGVSDLQRVRCVCIAQPAHEVAV
jgi:hypothetical protein